MCDTYETLCSGGCGKVIQVHIGDYSQGREYVTAWCADCVPAMVEWVRNKAKFQWYGMIFIDLITDRDQCTGGHVGDTVIFLSEIPHRITLN